MRRGMTREEGIDVVEGNEWGECSKCILPVVE